MLSIVSFNVPLRQLLSVLPHKPLVGLIMNVAVGFLAEVTFTVQRFPFVLLQPDHDWNEYPLAGVAFNTTAVFTVKFAKQVEPQFIPVGLELIVPVPALETERAYVGTDAVLTVYDLMAEVLRLRLVPLP